MEVFVEVHKTIIFTIYSALFLTSGGSVNDVLMRLSLVEEIIKDGI